MMFSFVAIDISNSMLMKMCYFVSKYRLIISGFMTLFTDETKLKIFHSKKKIDFRSSQRNFVVQSQIERINWKLKHCRIACAVFSANLLNWRFEIAYICEKCRQIFHLTVIKWCLSKRDDKEIRIRHWNSSSISTDRLRTIFESTRKFKVLLSSGTLLAYTQRHGS